MELPNFNYFYMGKEGGVVADALSAVRKMLDQRVVMIDVPGGPMYLRLEMQARRETSRITLRRGGEGDVFELLTSTNFAVMDATPLAELEDTHFVRRLMGWEADDMPKRIRIFKLSGDLACEVDCFSSMRVAEVKRCVAQVTAIPAEAQHLIVLDKHSLQLVVSRAVAPAAPVATGLEVRHVKDREALVTRLSQIRDGRTWDALLCPCRGFCHDAVSLSSGSSAGFCVLRTCGSAGTAIDRQPRAAMVRAGPTGAGDCIAFASARASGPPALNTVFKGELRLPGKITGPFSMQTADVRLGKSTLRPMLTAIALALAGAEQEKWRRRKQIDWIGSC